MQFNFAISFIFITGKYLNDVHNNMCNTVSIKRI